MNRLREKVSLKKKRFVQDSFNLDLSCTDELTAQLTVTYFYFI